MGTSFALQGTSCDVDGACDATGGCAHHITGYVRFLQGGSLTISDGTDSTTVTTAGAFTLPGNVYSGDPFTIALSGSTPGQVCTARSGTGTGVVGNSSPNVSIVCTLTLNSTGHVVGGWTFNSTSFTPMPSFLFPPLAFSTDGGDTDVLITTDAGQFASGTAEIGLEVDGVVVAQYTIELFNPMGSAYVVMTLSPGPHVIQADVRIPSGQNANVACLGSLNAIALDSLRSVAAKASVTLPAQTSGPNAELSGFPLSVPTAASTPLYLAHFNNVPVGAAFSVGGSNGATLQIGPTGAQAAVAFLDTPGSASPKELSFLTSHYPIGNSDANAIVFDGVNSSSIIGIPAFSNSQFGTVPIPGANVSLTTTQDSGLLYVIKTAAAGLNCDSFGAVLDGADVGLVSAYRSLAYVKFANVAAGPHTLQLYMNGPCTIYPGPTWFLGMVEVN